MKLHSISCNYSQPAQSFVDMRLWQLCHSQSSHYPLLATHTVL